MIYLVMTHKRNGRWRCTQAVFCFVCPLTRRYAFLRTTASGFTDESSAQNSTFCSSSPAAQQQIFSFLNRPSHNTFSHFDLVAQSLPWCFPSLSVSLTFTLLALCKLVPKNEGYLYAGHIHTVPTVCECECVTWEDWLLALPTHKLLSDTTFFYSLEKNEREENTNIHVNR